MRYGLRRSFRWAFVGMAIIPILLTGMGTTFVMWRYHLGAEHARLQELALRVAGAMMVEMRHGEMVLTALQHYRDLAGLPPARQEALLAEMVVRERAFRSTALVDAAGLEVARASNAEIVTRSGLTSRADEEAFRRVMQTGKVYYGPTRFDKRESAPLLKVAVPVFDGGGERLAAVLITDVRLRSLWQLLSQLSPGAGTQVYLTDDEGRVIAHANPSVVLRGTRSPPRDSSPLAKGLMGNRVYWAAHAIQLGERGFQVVAERDWAVAAKPILGAMAVLAAVLAVALIAAVLVARLFRQRVVMPVLAIEQTASSIANGDLNRRVDVEAGNELGVLAGSFNRMTNYLQQAMQQLRHEIDVHRQTQDDLQRTRDTLRSVIDTVPIAVFWKDLDSRYLGCNALFAHEAGQPGPTDVIGKLDAELAWWNDADAYVADDRQVITTGRPKLAFEESLTEPDGSLRWMRTSKVPLHNEHGEVVGVLGIFEDITEQKAAREALGRLNQELEARVEERTAELTRINKELESFSYSVSHDLRGPLRAVDGFAQFLVDDYGAILDDTGLDYLARIRAGAQRMGELIDDMLMLSRVSRRELAYTRVDLSAMSRKILEHLQQVEPQRRVDVRIEEGLVVQGDRNLLRIALENLLGNAWKYTGKNPEAHIVFGAETSGEGVAYFVRDDGVGFDMKYGDKLFGSFQRLHSEKDFPGTGVGLATVQRVIQRHGGRVWAHAAPGAGATFYFTLGAPALPPPTGTKPA